jgi:hypothetical protein
MRLPIRTLCALVALLALVAQAPVARAAAMLTASRDLATVGETILFDWQGLSDDAHEVELEVSLDGGRWLRMSPGLEPREGHFEWTVPAGLVGSARVRLRVGGRHDERVVAEVPLRLVADTVTGPRSTSEDWWSLEAHGASSTALGETATWSALTVTHTFTNDASPTSAPAPAVIEVPRTFAPGRPTAPVQPRAFTAPRDTPLRN